MIGRVLFYNDLFDDSEPDLTGLLSEIPSNIIIVILSHINAQLYIDNSLENQTLILKYLINRIDIAENERILDRYMKLTNRKNEVVAFPVFSNLKLIENEVLNYRKLPKTESTGVDELNILKAILITNALFDNDRLSKSRIKPKPNFIELLWILGFDQIEHNKNILSGLIPSLYYADKLFEYLKGENIEHYNNYLGKFSLKNHLDYLKNYLRLIQNGIFIKEKRALSLFNINLLEIHPFLADFCLDIDTIEVESYISAGKNIDFIGLRECPIIKHNGTQFTITNWNFILNKFLLGLMFDYYHNIYPERGNKAFLKFKGDLGEKFVEKSLLKNILYDIYGSDAKDIHFLSDDVSKGYNFDFYIRIENKILLIECKDYLMPIKAKCGNINETKKYLNENLGGAVKQLHNQIQKFNQSAYSSIEIPYELERIVIIPIIVYTDRFFSMPGINSMLDLKLKDLILQNKTKFFHIWELNLIHIDFFIRFQGVLKSNPKSILSLIVDCHHIKQAYLTQMKFSKSSTDLIKSESNFEDLLSEKLNIIDDQSLHKTVLEKLS